MEERCRRDSGNFAGGVRVRASKACRPGQPFQIGKPGPRSPEKVVRLCEYEFSVGTTTRWWRHGVAGDSAADFHFCDLLFSLDSSPTTPPEEMAGHARYAQDRRQGSHQRWP